MEEQEKEASSLSKGALLIANLFLTPVWAKAVVALHHVPDARLSRATR